MDERQLLIEELADGHRMVGAALSDLSSEVAEWQPGGTANSIASLLAHTIVGEDRVVNQMLGSCCSKAVIGRRRPASPLKTVKFGSQAGL